MMRATLLLVLMLASSCAAADPELPLPEPPVPPSAPVVTVEPSAANVALPKHIRAALDRAVPQENALAASPASDSEDIRLVRLLHHNVVAALATLERDNGRHVTPAQVARAQTAVKDLQNHLNEFQAAHGGAPPAP
jgi:hypothetical protein